MRLLSTFLVSLFRSRCRLEAKNAAVGHQVMVLRRQAHGRIHFAIIDRLLLVQLSFDGIGPGLLLLAPEVAFAGRAAAD